MSVENTIVINIITCIFNNIINEVVSLNYYWTVIPQLLQVIGETVCGLNFLEFIISQSPSRDPSCLGDLRPFIFKSNVLLIELNSELKKTVLSLVCTFESHAHIIWYNVFRGCSSEFFCTCKINLSVQFCISYLLYIKHRITIMMAAILHLAIHKHPHFFCFARDTVHLFNYNILYAMCLFLLIEKHVLQTYSQWNGYVQGQFTDLLLRRLFNAFKSIDTLVSNVYNY